MKEITALRNIYAKRGGTLSTGAAGDGRPARKNRKIPRSGATRETVNKQMALLRIPTADDRR